MPSATAAVPGGGPTAAGVNDDAAAGEWCFPIGRLDYESEGAMLVGKRERARESERVRL